MPKRSYSNFSRGKSSLLARRKSKVSSEGRYSKSNCQSTLRQKLKASTKQNKNVGENAPPYVKNLDFSHL
jgi:hypothetical protein